MIWGWKFIEKSAPLEYLRKIAEYEVMSDQGFWVIG